MSFDGKMYVKFKAKEFPYVERCYVMNSQSREGCHITWKRCTFATAQSGMDRFLAAKEVRLVVGGAS